MLVSAGASFDWPTGGHTHMAPGDVALLDTLDGWTVHVPGHPDEAETLLRHAVAAGDDKVYVRLSLQSNTEGRPVDGQRFLTAREGRAGVVVAVGPMLDAVLAATEGLDVTVLYATTVRPFDADALRRATATAGTDVVLVEPYLAGTSTAAANDVLADVPHRVLGLGVGRAELRRYGQFEEHLAAHGLDARSLRERITRFTAVPAGRLTRMPGERGTRGVAAGTPSGPGGHARSGSCHGALTTGGPHGPDSVSPPAAAPAGDAPRAAGTGPPGARSRRGCPAARPRPPAPRA